MENGVTSRQTPCCHVEPRVNPRPLGRATSPGKALIEHNLPSLLQQVSGSSNLQQVQQLRLRVELNELSLQQVGVWLPRLRELDLSGSGLSSLRDLGCQLPSLEILRVRGCGLSSLDGLATLPTLRELHASNNRVTNVAPCTWLMHLRLLDLSNNMVENLHQLGFLALCPSLEQLHLEGCPAAHHEGYRAMVRALIPGLGSLDGHPATEDCLDKDATLNAGILLKESPLASGSVVCGNLASALRQKRTKGKGEHRDTAQKQSGAQELLNASRRWRIASNTLREQLQRRDEADV